MIGSLGHAVNHTLHGCRDLTEGPHLEAGVAELAALQVGHLEAKTPHQLIVDEGRGGSREMRGCEKRKWPTFDTKHILLLFVSILIKSCWFSFHFHSLNTEKLLHTPIFVSNQLNWDRDTF